MKEIIIALKDNIESRFKNIVITSILIAEVICNWKGLSILLLSDKAGMIKIITEYQFDWWGDALLPILIGLLYVTVFQFILYGPTYVAEKISLIISKRSAMNAAEKLKLQSKLNRIAILSDFEYQKSVRMGKLQAAIEKYNTLERSHAEKKEQNAALEVKVKEMRGSIDTLTTTVNEKDSERKQLITHSNLRLMGIKYNIESIIDALEYVTFASRIENKESEQEIVLDSLKEVVNNMSYVKSFNVDKHDKEIVAVDKILSQINKDISIVNSAKLKGHIGVTQNGSVPQT